MSKRYHFVDAWHNRIDLLCYVFLELKISSDVVIKSIMQWLISVHGDKLGLNGFLGRKLKITVELCNKNYAAKYVPMFAYVLHKFWPFAYFMTTEIASVFGGLSFILFVSVCECVCHKKYYAFYYIAFIEQQAKKMQKAKMEKKCEHVCTCQYSSFYLLTVMKLNHSVTYLLAYNW